MTLNAGDFDVWHDAFSPRASNRDLLSPVSERLLEFLSSFPEPSGDFDVW